MKAYPDATRWLCDQIENNIVDGKICFRETTFARTALLASGLVQFIDDGYKAYYRISDSMSFHLWKLAREDYQIFDLCSEICAVNIGTGVQLPSFLRHFASYVLMGDLLRPTPNHRERGRNWHEQYYI